MAKRVDFPTSIAGWSSLVARRAHNPKVVGSNPAPATNSDGSKLLLSLTAIASSRVSVFHCFILCGRPQNACRVAVDVDRQLAVAISKR